MENKKSWFKANPLQADARPQKLWFRVKRYGWGWTPCTWQGWAVLGLYLFVIFSNATHLTNHASSDLELLLQFLLETYILTVFLLIICYATGEKPGWRWQRERNRPGVPEMGQRERNRPGVPEGEEKTN